MKAIFLDLEGPIITHRSIIVQTSRCNGQHYGRSSGWHRFVDQLSLGLVAQLMVRFQASVVVTSMLRTDSDVMDQLTHLLSNRVNYMDSDFKLPVVHGITTDLNNKREDEIRAYVKKHKITHWVAIDDRKLALGDNMVVVDARDGITYADYQNCKGCLADADSAADMEALKPEAIFL